MIIDTNIILRFLLGEADDAVLQVLKDEAVVITDLVLAEVVYVLSGRQYNYTRTGIRNALAVLLERDNVQHLTHVGVSYLDLYAATRLDLADCYLIELALQQKKPLKTFDKKVLHIYERRRAGKQS